MSGSANCRSMWGGLRRLLSADSGICGCGARPVPVKIFLDSPALRCHNSRKAAIMAWSLHPCPDSREKTGEPKRTAENRPG